MREEVKNTVDEIHEQADGIRERTQDVVRELPGRIGEVPGRISELPGKVAAELPDRDAVQGAAVGVVRKAENAPSIAYMALVLGSMAASAVLLMRKKQAMGIFVGLWPATILSLVPLVKERRKGRRLSQEIDSMRAGRDDDAFLVE